MVWFTGITSVGDLRNHYKKLLMKYHPDNNPSADTTKTMQQINEEYDRLIKQLKATDSTYKENSNFSEEKWKAILNAVMRLKADIVVEVIGNWIWIDGNTYPIKDELLKLNFKWAPLKKKWFWGTHIYKHSVPMDMDAIRDKYGSTTYRNNAAQNVIGAG